MAKFQDIFRFSFLCLSIIGVFSNCSTNTTDYFSTERFYYPVYELKNGKFYEYVSQQDSSHKAYSFIQTIRKDGESFMAIQQYDNQLNVIQYALEKVVSNGAKMIEIKFFDPALPPAGLAADVEFGASFPFEIKDSLGIFVTNLTYTTPDSTFYRVIRNKRYKRLLDVSFEKATLQGVELSVVQQLEQDKNGVLKVQTKETQIFVEGIGLFSYTKYLTDTDRSTFTLNKIYTPDAFHNLHQDKFD